MTSIAERDYSFIKNEAQAGRIRLVIITFMFAFAILGGSLILKVSDLFTGTILITIYLIIIVGFASYIANKYEQQRNIDQRKICDLIDWSRGNIAFLKNSTQQSYIRIGDEHEILEWLNQNAAFWAKTREVSKARIWTTICDFQHELFYSARIMLLDQKTDGLHEIAKLNERNGILHLESAIGRYVQNPETPSERILYACCFLAEVDYNFSYTRQIDDKKVICNQTRIREDLQGVFRTTFDTVNEETFGQMVLKDLVLVAIQQASSLQEQVDQLDMLRRDMTRTLQEANSTLSLRPAAKRWRNSAYFNFFLAIIGLSPFVLICASLIFNWETIIGFAQYLFSPDSKGSLPIDAYRNTLKDLPWSAVVFISIPAIFLAWLLKHFSRMFVQGFNLANDARYRSALAQVYADVDAKHELTNDQKRIVFEAMFRPRNVAHNDDGIPYSPVENLTEVVRGNGR